MESRKKTFGALALTAAFIAGCQVYNFEPVSPLSVAQTTQSTPVIGTQLKPNVMLVVDKSGSMNKPLNPADPSCTPGCGSNGDDCPVACQTRLEGLQDAMDAFLQGSGGLARFGLMQLPKPGSNLCDPSGVGDILTSIPAASTSDDPAALQSAANAIDAQIKVIIAGGGTPTAATLGSLVSYAPLLDSTRQNFVFLLTDGEPNCNAQNPNNCMMSSCKCTIYSGSSPAPNICPGPGCGCGNSTTDAQGNPVLKCEQGCLDQDAVVQSINALRTKAIDTIPIGFGFETIDGGSGTGFAPVALNAMALAGGAPRACPLGTDQECNIGVDGGLLQDTCDLASGKVCNGGYCCARRYYVALDSLELQHALKAACDQVGCTSTPCTFKLQTVPSDPSLLAVLVNGVDVPATGESGVNWTYTPPSAQSALPVVQFQGQVCTELTSSTPANPVEVEFRIVQVQ